MDMANFTILKEVYIKDNGRTILCTARVTYTIQMVDWLMKGTGEWISFMVMAKYTIKTKSLFKDHLIIGIFQM